MKINYCFILLIFVFESAVAYDDSKAAVYEGLKINKAPMLDNFTICYGYSCKKIVDSFLDHNEWQQIQSIFSPPAENAEDERNKIRKTVAKLELMIGKKTKTDSDKGGNFRGFFLGGQMDCIDESNNTTTYLKLLAQYNLLQWHTVEKIHTRGLHVFQSPHSSAVIKEKKSGQAYVVDSWFYDNGVEPEIVTLKNWKKGWRPEKAHLYEE